MSVIPVAPSLLAPAPERIRRRGPLAPPVVDRAREATPVEERPAARAAVAAPAIDRGPRSGPGPARAAAVAVPVEGRPAPGGRRPGTAAVPVEGRRPGAGPAGARPVAGPAKGVGRAQVTGSAVGAAGMAKAAVRPAELVLSRSPGRVARAGVLWAAALTVGMLLGPVGLLVVLLPAVAVAAGSALRRTKVRSSLRPLVLAVVALVPLASLGGVSTWAVGSVLAAGVILVLLAPTGQSHPLRSVALLCWPGLAAGAVVAASVRDLSVAALLVASACLFDAANYVAGTGDEADVRDTGGWVGALAGSALVAMLLLAFSRVVDASLRGRPFAVLAVLIVFLLPVGVEVVRRVTGPLPLRGFRRLDSLMVLAPIWVVAMAVVLPH